MNISNEEAGELIRNDPTMVMYLSLKKDFIAIENRLRMVETNQELQETRLDSQENKINNLDDEFKEKNESDNKRFEKIDNKLDVYKNDDTGQFGLYKSTAKARIYSLVGDAGTIEHILFYGSFLSKIYKDICKELGANNSGSIKLSDSDRAISLARNWNPKKTDIRNKLNEYLKMDSLTMKAKNKLPDKAKERLAVLHDYLDKTNGGNDIEF